MEKIIVRINRVNVNSTDFTKRTLTDDIGFLRSCFNISYKRAVNILNEMKFNRDSCSTDECVLNLNYEQLARFVAKR